MAVKTRTKLDLGTLGTLRGGLVGKVFDKEQARVLRDLNDRPKNRAARKVMIEVAFVPSEDDEDKVDITVQVQSKVPAQAIDAHQARLVQRHDRATGQNLIDAVVGADADDADQATLDELADEKKKG
jgi:hypothetical protein